MTGYSIRPELPGDEAAIRDITMRAFVGRPYSDGDEAEVIERLRADGDLVLSLVAVSAGTVIGQVTFSAARLSNGETGWFVLGPIAVAPERQGEGVGRALIAAGEAAVRGLGAKGMTVLGNPQIYGRFGFVRDTAMRQEDELGAFLQVKTFGAAIPDATISYASAFG
jgi:predicted N-acetyltransferase YhbS